MARLFKRLKRMLRMASAMPPTQLYNWADFSLRQVYYKSFLYPLIEDEQTPPANKLVLDPPHLWKGDKKQGADIAKNTFTFADRTINFGQHVQWLPGEATPMWVSYLQGFGWLGHLRAQNVAGVRHARRLIEDWILSCSKFHSLSWAPAVMATRLVAWFTHGQWLLKDISTTEREQFFKSIDMQVSYLAKNLPWHWGGARLVRSLKALIYAGLCLPGRQSLYLEAMNALTEQLKTQILEDGTHISRSAYYHYRVLRDLLDIQAIILKASQQPPVALTEAIDKMATSLAFLRHKDGTLALFHDGEEGREDRINGILARCHVADEIPAQLPEGGFVRLARGRSVLLMQAGPLATPCHPFHAHACALAFEYSYGAEKVFVNQGTYAFIHAQRNIFRGTKAHNTVEIEKQNSADIFGHFGLARQPKTTAEVMVEKAIGLGVEAAHDGYKHLGASHTRRIFMSEDGKDVRGEDVIKSKKAKNVAAHFHLHPSVSVHLKNEQTAELTTKEGQKFVFKLSGGRLYETESVYAACFGARQTTRQLVVKGKWQNGQVVLKWALKAN